MVIQSLCAKNRPCNVIYTGHMADIPKDLEKFKGPTREKVRRALVRVIETQELRASTKLVSIARVRGAGGGDQNCITECVRAWRAGALTVAEPWDDAPAKPVAAGAEPAEGHGRKLAEVVALARTDADREAALHLVAVQLADEVLDPARAREIRGALAEARQAAEAKREVEPPPEDPRKLLLASAEAMDAARALDLFVDDERRDRVLALIAAELEADRVANPNVDEGAA